MASKIVKIKQKNNKKRIINQYLIEKTLGVGSFATVKLCRDTKTNI